MKTLQEFEIYFNSDMIPDLELLDKRRRTVVNRTIVLMLGVFMALFLIVILYSSFGRSAENPNMVYYYIVPGIIVVIAAVIFGKTWASDQTYYIDFKKQVIDSIVKFISPDLTYEPKNFVGSDSFQRSRFFLKNVDRYKGDDMVQGKVDKTQIWFSEIKADYKTTTTDNKGRTKTTWHTLFKGMFFIADFNKHFQASTIVLPKRLGKGFLAKIFKKMNLARKEKQVKLEDPDFNKHFFVYGEDQVEARYVMSSSLMRRIIGFKKKHPNPLYISFVNSFLYVGIAYRKNLFEPRWFNSLTRFGLVRGYFENIHLAVSIVEELNLNNRIWTKQ